MWGSKDYISKWTLRCLNMTQICISLSVLFSSNTPDSNPERMKDPEISEHESLKTERGNHWPT